MSEETTTEQGLKVSVTFDRKLSDGDYGSVEARAWVESEVPRNAEEDAIVARLQAAFAAAKAVVLDELGVPYTMDPDTGVIREKVIPQALVTAEERIQHEVPGTHGVKVMNAGKPNVSTDPIPSWALDAFAKDGVTAVYDNRLDAAGTKRPHFKQALTKAQMADGVDAKAYWPPRG